MRKKLFGSITALILIFSTISIASASSVYWPTTSDYVTSEFGMRTDPFTGKQTMHYGIDIGPLTPKVAGDTVRTMYNGVVKSAGWNSSYGNVVFVDHVGVNQVKYSDIQSIYAHLESISVTTGQKLSGGAQVGKMGTTGDSTGVHLHFETRTCPTSACSTSQSRDAVNPRIWYSSINSLIDETTQDKLNESQDGFNELHEVDDLSIDSPNYYPLEVLVEMTPEELIEIGYPNPYEFQ